MTDDLVKRLQAGNTNHVDARLWMYDAATRIEELQARVDELEKDLGCADAYQREWEQHCKTAEARAEELEAKLAKAIWRLEQMRDDNTGYRHSAHFRRGASVTLTELTGGKDE